MTGRVLAAALAFAGGPALAQQGLTEGNPESPVRVIIYEDLQCSDCADFRVMMDEKILARYGSRAAFLHRDFPLAKHAWARRAAVAARFFAEKDPALGLKYRRETMAQQRDIKPDNFNEKLAAFARTNGVDAAAALAALENPKYAEAVERDYQEGVARGVAHTPTVFVNGRPFIETFTFEEISKGIEQALAETK